MKPIQEYFDFVQSASNPDQLAVKSGKFIDEILGQKQFVILKHRYHPRPFSSIYDKYTGFDLNKWMRSFIDFKETITPFKPILFKDDYLYFLTDLYDESIGYFILSKNKLPDEASDVLAAWQNLNIMFVSAEAAFKSELSIELGNLISQLTHDIQSIITLCEEIKKPEPLATRLKYQEKVNSNILFISREPELLKSKINLADLIDAALDLININSKEISLTISGNISDIEVDVELFARAFNETVKNAIAALGGDLAGLKISADPLPSVSPFRREGWVVIKISDKGPGIAGDFLPSVSDAFFTTAKSEGSTGFGLTIARKIIRAHYGQLEIQSRPGSGTTVLIYLPQIQDE